MMKTYLYIFIFILLTNCSNLKDDVSQIGASFNKLIIFRKNIDSRVTRAPIGNKQYINKTYVKSNFGKDDLNSKQASVQINDIPKIQEIETEKKSSKLNNLFKTKKKNEDEKYPKLNSVPKANVEHKKIIEKSETEIKNMQKDIEEVKEEIKHIEDHNIKIEEKEIKEIKKDLETIREEVKSSEQDNIHKEYKNKPLSTKIENKITSEKSPRMLKDLDESGIYIKPAKSRQNTRPTLLPDSRY